MVCHLPDWHLPLENDKVSLWLRKINGKRILGATVAAEALRDKFQAAMTDQERAEYEQSVAQLRAMLVETEINMLWAEGKSMTMDQAIQLALNL